MSSSSYNNACSVGAQSTEEAQKQTWHKLDCLAKYQLNSGHDNKTLIEWFKSQNEEWQASRQQRFTARLNQRRW